jgi:hypothetical protein
VDVQRRCASSNAGAPIGSSPAWDKHLRRLRKYMRQGERLPSKDYFDSPKDLVEKLVEDTEKFGIQFVMARPLAEEYVGESHSMTELIGQLRKARANQKDRLTKRILTHLILRARALARNQ